MLIMSDSGATEHFDHIVQSMQRKSIFYARRSPARWERLSARCCSVEWIIGNGCWCLDSGPYRGF